MKESHKRSSSGTSPVAHVIKKNRLETSHFEAIDPSLLAQQVRVPRSMVAADTAPVPEEDGLPLRRVFRGGDAQLAAVPFEIFTKNFDKIRSPRVASEERPPEPAPSIEDVERQWQERLDREVERTREQAFQDGVATAQAGLQAKLDEALQSFASDLNGIQASWESHIRRSEPHLVQLAFRIARAVLDAPLPDDVRQVSEAAISEAIERMANGVSVEIILHPVSYLRMQESGVEEQLSAMHSKLRWRTNPEMRQNEWVVQSSRSTTRRLEAELLDNLQRDLTMRDMQRENDSAEESV